MKKRYIYKIKLIVKTASAEYKIDKSRVYDMEMKNGGLGLNLLFFLIFLFKLGSTSLRQATFWQR